MISIGSDLLNGVNSLIDTIIKFNPVVPEFSTSKFLVKDYDTNLLITDMPLPLENSWILSINVKKVIIFNLNIHFFIKG